MAVSDMVNSPDHYTYAKEKMGGSTSWTGVSRRMSKVIRFSDPEDRKAPPKRYTVEILQYTKLF